MAGRLIISNTTPLINFAEIGRMDILESLFGTLMIPPSVVAELTAKSGLFPEAARVPHLPCIHHQAPADQLLTRGLSRQVHSGEAECLALAMENPGALLLLDDLAAREVAAGGGLLFTGTLGCLIEAWRRGFVTAIAPLLDALRHKARFWISGPLAHQVLTASGEIHP